MDSGACANLIPISVYSRLFDKSDRDLKTTIDHRVKLIAANNKQIKQLGTVNLRVKAEDREKVCKFYIVPDSCRPILGLPDLKRMDLVQFKVPTTSQWTDYVSSIEPSTPNTNPTQPKEPRSIQKGITKDQVLAKYKKVFTGLGRLKVTPVKIHLKPGVEPQQKPCRRVPIAIRGQFKDELDSMEGQGTITKLDKNTVTPWLNSFVNVGKKDQKSLRVCLDPTGLNPYIIRPVCNSYTLDEISYMLKDAKVMSVVDANKGFFQIPLDDESKLLTAMGTPYGVYIFNVLAMGLSLASDVFEITIRDITKDLKGVINIADDILVYGSTVEEHDRNLLALLDRALEVNLTLNPKKFKFKCTSVPFFGNILTDNGIKPDPTKVESIKNWPIPKTVKDLQSFLGAVNFLGKFIQGLSSLRSSLQGLIKKDAEYVWTGTHTNAFNTIKEAICQETLLAYYDKDKPVFIEVDASGQGLGAVLLQGNILEEELLASPQTEGRYLSFRNRLKPIAFASKSLSDAETRYSNIERELLGVVWAVEHFHHYTFANKINIISDHKPLHPLFSGKSLVSCSPRTARLLLKIVDKDIRFFYQNGPTMHISDALSRLPTHNTNAGNQQEVKGLKVSISEISPVQSNVSFNQFKEHTSKDQVMQQLLEYVMKGWPRMQKDCIEQLRAYHTFKEEISTIDGLLFKGQRLIVPSALRSKVLQVLHRSHMGVTKTQDRARSTFFWVGISKEIENVIGNCEVCQRYAKRQPKECQGHVQDISEAWESTATDLFEFKGNTYLIISCRFSGYMAIRDMKDHSAEETIKQCQSIFRELGVPKTLHCDRGSNYTSVQFQEFAKSINMNLTFGSSEHHSSNYAERSVQTVKNFMRKSQEWSICLLEYHMTPIRHQGAESSPMRLMQQRTIRGILPTRQQETNQCNYEKFRTRKLEQSQYQTGQNLPTLPIGSNVLYYSAVRNQWSPGVIVERVHDRSYTVISQKGRMLSRNRVDLKPYHKEVTISFEPPKSPSSPFDMPGQQTNRHTDKTNKDTSSHPSSQTKTQLVHTRMAHTLGHHHKSSSQTDRHCHRHDQKPPSYSSEYSSKNDSSPTLSCKHQRSPPNPEYQKGSTSANQNTSFKASTRKNQSPNECKSKAKGDSNNVSLPSKTRSGRTVRLPGRYRE